DPTDPTVLYVATRGSASPLSQGGVWKSTNANAATPTFTRLTGFPNTAIASPLIARISLAIGSGAAHTTLYAALENLSTTQVWGIYKTTDAGATWNHLDNGVNGIAKKENGGNLLAQKGIPLTAVGHRVIVLDNLGLRSLTIT